MSEPTDEFAGHGGSYSVNAETQRRELIERTQPAPPPAQPTETTEQPA